MWFVFLRKKTNKQTIWCILYVQNQNLLCEWQCCLSLLNIKWIKNRGLNKAIPPCCGHDIHSPPLPTKLKPPISLRLCSIGMFYFLQPLISASICLFVCLILPVLWVSSARPFYFRHLCIRLSSLNFTANQSDGLALCCVFSRSSFICVSEKMKASHLRYFRYVFFCPSKHAHTHPHSKLP